MARSCAEAGVIAIDQGADDEAAMSALSKAKTGEFLFDMSNQLIQIHGGIGMTDEFDAGLILNAPECRDHVWQSSPPPRSVRDTAGLSLWWHKKAGETRLFCACRVRFVNLDAVDSSPPTHGSCPIAPFCAPADHTPRQSLFKVRIIEDRAG